MRQTDHKTSNATKALRARLLVGLRRWRSSLLAMGVLVLLMVMFSGSTLLLAARPESCLTCHEMEPHYVQWQASTHKGVICIDCHTEPGLAGLAKIEISMLKNTAGHVAGTYMLPIRADVHDDSCLRCHPKDSRPEVLLQASLRVAHSSHEQIGCAECHGRLVHTLGQEPLALAITHQGGEKACGVCHTRESCPHGTADVDCASCHSGTIPRHSLASNGVVLPREGCIDCHNRMRVSAEEACQTCHISPHGIEQACNTCHTSTDTWYEKQLVHQFALDGTHASLSCAKCHDAGAQMTASTACATCHQPKHAPYGSNDCTSCHTVSGWRQSTAAFDHSLVWDGFVGKHAEIGCETCHTEGTNVSPSPTCSSCHQVTQPHFGDNCAACHQPSAPFKRS